jgi:hypothetical protein
MTAWLDWISALNSFLCELRALGGKWLLTCNRKVRKVREEHFIASQGAI